MIRRIIQVFQMNSSNALCMQSWASCIPSTPSGFEIVLAAQMNFVFTGMNSEMERIKSEEHVYKEGRSLSMLLCWYRQRLSRMVA